MQIVRSIVPASADVYMLSGFGGMIDDVAVVHVAAVFQERIIAAALLPHVVQHVVCSTVVDLCIDGETGGDRFACFQIIRARFCEITEVQPVGTLHASHLAGGLGCVEGTHHLSGESVNQ